MKPVLIVLCLCLLSAFIVGGFRNLSRIEADRKERSDAFTAAEKNDKWRKEDNGRLMLEEIQREAITDDCL